MLEAACCISVSKIHSKLPLISIVNLSAGLIVASGLIANVMFGVFANTFFGFGLVKHSILSDRIKPNQVQWFGWLVWLVIASCIEVTFVRYYWLVKLALFLVFTRRAISHT